MAHKLAVILLCAAAASIFIGGAAAAVDVETFSFPVFNATTTGNLIAVTNTSTVLEGANILFVRDQASAAINRSEGILLLRDRIGIWRPRDGATDGVPDREASFNSTFTLSGARPRRVRRAQGQLPVDKQPGLVRRREPLNLVRAGRVRIRRQPGRVGRPRRWPQRHGHTQRDGSEQQDGVGGVQRNRASPVGVRRRWGQAIEAGQGYPRRLDAKLNLAAGGRTTETAKVGFFASRISDIIDGVSGWELTVDELPGKSDGIRNKRTSWVVILVAVLVSVAVTVAM